jgi:hypothetical protein
LAWSFPTGLRGVHSIPAPVLLRVRVHPLMRLTFSSEYMTTPDLAGALSSDSHLPWGSPSPSRHQCKEFTSQQASHTRLRSALSVSHALDGFSLSAPCGLVSSRYHVLDFLFRGFPRCPTEPPHRRPVPSWHWRPSPPTESPRLSSSSYLLFRVLIQTTIRPVKQGV